jgi:multimeric flavodoxin WrbA
MQILALIGSPRRGGNTDILVEQILKGAKKRGFTSNKLYLYDYEISPCVDCRTCKKGDHVCALNDGMNEIYPIIDHSDLLIFGTPNYWYGPTGKMKLFIDRMRPYGTSGKLSGKKAVIVIPAGGGPEACGALVEMLRLSFGYLEMDFVGKFLAKAYEKAEIMENPGKLEEAYDFGFSIGRRSKP